MTNVNELLRNADPLLHEYKLPMDQLQRRRQAILASAAGMSRPVRTRSRQRIAVFAAIVLMTAGVSFLGSRAGWPLVEDVQAAVRFEIRLAEDRPAAGLHEAKVSDSGRSVYLHDEVVVTNGDIASARVVDDNAGGYSISVAFSSSGSGKLSTSTKNHLGKPMAILIDGQVIMAPTLRTPIGSSAMITGKFTKDRAEGIVKGITGQ